MTALPVQDLVHAPASNAVQRPERRRAAIDLRRSRRVQLGPMVAVEFENADTLRYQAQEMLFVERVTDRRAAEAELAVYQRLVPGPTTLTATLLVEIADQDQVRAELGRLAGLHDCVRLEIGTQVCPAVDVPPPDEGPSSRTFSVHFLRFDLTADAADALRGDAPARLVVDHPEYQATATLGPQTRAQLVQDLQGA
jgi:hypothetical protein